jgi:hypothetical protein
MACGQVSQCTGSQLRVLRLSFFQDGDVGLSAEMVVMNHRSCKIEGIDLLAANVAQHRRGMLNRTTCQFRQRQGAKLQRVNELPARLIFNPQGREDEVL